MLNGGDHPEVSMPLLDHFRPPLTPFLWERFVDSWAADLASSLNTVLPNGYFAQASLRFDIPLDEDDLVEPGTPTPPCGWTPPPPAWSLAFEARDWMAEVGVYNRAAGTELAGAIMLVGPGDKHTPGAREAFVTKCAAYLGAWVGLVLVDVVTLHPTDLHAPLLNRMGTSTPAEPGLFAAAYRPIGLDGCARMDVWHEPVAVGRVLPTLPLWLRGGLCLPVELEASYTRTCVE
jgi:hypothetical protein